MSFKASAIAMLRPSSGLGSRGSCGSASQGPWAPEWARGSFFAPLVGYWVLVGAVTIDLQTQWTVGVFGPVLVLTAGLDAFRRGRR